MPSKPLIASWLGELISCADDFVILSKTKQQALESIRVIQAIVGKLDLSISKEKSNSLTFGMTQTVLIF